ncbi:MAG: permease-like cell division protein FtsX [Acidimicrobiales bacterium]
MIDIEEELADHLTRRAAQASSHRDVDAVMAESAVVLLRVAPHRRAVSPWLVRLAVGAAAAVGVATVGVFALRSDSPRPVVAGPQDSAGPTCDVFIRPEATAQEIAGVGDALRQQTGVTQLRLTTQQQAYEEFLRRFADNQELTSSVTADILPARWTFVLASEIAARNQSMTATFGSDPAVKQVRCTPFPSSPEPTLVPATGLSGGSSATTYQMPAVTRQASATDCADGERTVAVPDVKGKLLRDALALMRDAGLFVFESGVPAGDPTGPGATVWAQEPDAGTLVPVGACIGFRTRN